MTDPNPTLKQKADNWVMRFFNGTDPQREVTLVAFVGVVAFGIVAMGFDLYVNRKITENWISAFWVLASLVGLGGPAHAVVTKWRSNANEPPAGPGIPDQGGNQ